MNLKLSILSFCVVITTAREHHIRANLDDGHQLRFRATESALRRLLEREENIRSKKDAEEFHVLRGSSRFLPSTNCEDGGGNTWSCDRDTEECGATPDKCITVCVAEVDCNGNGECKNGDSCECDDRFDGDSCDECAGDYYRYKDDCRYYDVGIAYEFIFHFADNEEEEECLELIDSLEDQLNAFVDDLPDEATVKVSGSGKIKRSHRRHLKSPHSKSELEVPILVEVGECDPIELVNAAILAVQDVSLPTGATFRTGRSKGSRD